MVVFPNCKINLGLTVSEKRNDGYHNIDTVFFPIPLCDALEAVRKENSFAGDATANLKFTTTGLQIDGVQDDNLCVKAYRLLKNDFPDLPSFEMHLHKTIPSGAGLGGGSSDGAFALRLFNNLFYLGIPDERLAEYALSLGSDCPFFLFNQPCSGSGRGEQLIPLDNSLLRGYYILLVNPGIHINTKWAFEQISPVQGRVHPKQIVQLPVVEWKDKLNNDFEGPVSAKFPVIREIRDALYGMGAIYAAMSGTGSTVYGIFKNNIDASGLFPRDYFVSQHLL